MKRLNFAYTLYMLISHFPKMLLWMIKLIPLKEPFSSIEPLPDVILWLITTIDLALLIFFVFVQTVHKHKKSLCSSDLLSSKDKLFIVSATLNVISVITPFFLWFLSKHYIFIPMLTFCLPVVAFVMFILKFYRNSTDA